jgi:mannonate dehydratase
MQMTFRWFGPQDPVRLENVRQIPGVEGIVSALHDEPPGKAWTRERIVKHRDRIEEAGLRFAVVESIPVHEDIKLGRPTRDRLTDAFAASVRAMGEAGVRVLCYNVMPVFDWMRTDLALRSADGSNGLAYDHGALATFDATAGTAGLPGWAEAYDAGTLGALRAAYRDVDEERLWDNVAWFLERVVPAAAEAGVRMAVHPDDPPWPILGLPRILTSGAALERYTRLVDHPANGVTLCTGSLGADPDNDVVEITRRLAGAKRIHFMHCRNVRSTGERRFLEAPHPTRFGDVDMRGVLKALRDHDWDGPIRPDHGRMIWGERGRPGYGLHDRALGAMYLQGLWEGLDHGGEDDR